jgi:glycosyltransferase involved in cell wall biosynthesis
VNRRDAVGHAEPRATVKIGIVVQRYGAEINGGAEQHARYVAEHLSRHVSVEVLTTCATDYITWQNALNAGPETVNGVPVRRFPVVRERDPEEFARHSDRVFGQEHSLDDELAWLESEGPTSPALIEHIRTHDADFDFFIFFSFRYYHAYHGIRAVPAKAILVPTAERDSALGLAMFTPVFRAVRAVMYNSFEERALIQTVSANQEVPGVVVGIGSEIPLHSSAIRFRQKFNLRERFAIYIGRIDENKGCAELFDYFQRYARMLVEGLHLVLIGTPVIPIPQHPRIHHLGFVGDQDKFDALSAADLLIMPSYFESLSMVALEAWALGKPVLANGRCDVLRGQCIRSNGGLYYDDFAEFVETLRAFDFNPSLALALGRNGREYFARHYAWPVIERKYLDMLDRLKREPPRATFEPLPGWWARRRRTQAPADRVVAQLPTGAVLQERESPPRAAETTDAPSPIAAGNASPSISMSDPPPRPEQTPSPEPPGVRPRSTAQRRPEAGRRPAATLPARPSTRPRSNETAGRLQASRPNRHRRPGGRPPRRRGQR